MDRKQQGIGILLTGLPVLAFLNFALQPRVLGNERKIERKTEKGETGESVRELDSWKIEKRIVGRIWTDFI